MSEISVLSQGLIDELVASGRFIDRQAVLEEALQRLRDEFQANEAWNAVQGSADEWCAQFEAWAANHRAVPHEAEDSREAIYAGRGE
jgi:Arc/MetJ-type ribon-helix-helix transcriptional regulator